MQNSADMIRKHFLLRHGEAAFENVAKRFAEVSGDPTLLDLSSIEAWRDFASSFTVIPLSSVLTKAFLWCIRHDVKLEEIRRPTIPPTLNDIEDPEVIRELFEYCPYFLASSRNGFRCVTCFDTAAKLTEIYVGGDRQIRSFQIAAQSLSPRSHLNRKRAATERPIE